MIGFFIGIIGGSIEFVLLYKFVNAITSGGRVSVVTILLKLFVLAGALLLCAFTVPDELAWAGIGFVLPLILGAVIRFVVYMIKKA